MKVYYFLFAILAAIIAAVTVSSLSIESPSAEPEIKRFRFYGYQVFRARPETEEQFKALISLYTGDPSLDFWRVGHGLGDFSDVMVAPEKNAFFQEYLKNHEIPYQLNIADVERLAEEERRANDAVKQAEKSRSRSSREMTWDRYYNLDEIYASMDELAAAHGDTAKMEVIGTTYENRPIKAMCIPKDQDPAKPTIVIDGGIHAREWISPAVCLYILNQLLNPANNPEILEAFNIIIIPVLNPDGYAYTQTYRFWRKNRNVNPGSNCRGVDLNRNFEHHWSEVGSSTESCSDIFHGPSAASEAETVALQNLLFSLENMGSKCAYFTFHSYGQYFLTPWGYTTAYPEDYSELKEAAEVACDAIYMYENKNFTIGTSTNALYAAAGGSDDYAKGVAGIKYSHCIELRDTGTYGFSLPPNQIMPSCKEMMSGFVAFCNHIKSKMT